MQTIDGSQRLTWEYALLHTRFGGNRREGQWPSIAPAIGESVNNGKASRSNASGRSEIIAQMSVRFGSAFYPITSSARPKFGIVIPAALKAAAMIGPGATRGGVRGGAVGNSGTGRPAALKAAAITALGSIG